MDNIYKQNDYNTIQCPYLGQKNERQYTALMYLISRGGESYNIFMQFDQLFVRTEFHIQNIMRSNAIYLSISMGRYNFTKYFFSLSCDPYYLSVIQKHLKKVSIRPDVKEIVKKN